MTRAFKKSCSLDILPSHESLPPDYLSGRMPLPAGYWASFLARALSSDASHSYILIVISHHFFCGEFASISPPAVDD